MSISGIFNSLETKDNIIEFSIKELEDRSIIIGHIDKKGDNGEILGELNRFEFAVEDLNEQKEFLNKYLNYLESRDW